MEYEVVVRSVGIVETRIRVEAPDRAVAEELAIDEARGRPDELAWEVLAARVDVGVLDSVADAAVVPGGDDGRH